jgi:hypothetical protein
MTATHTEVHANVSLLADVYADLTRLAHYADDGIVLHRADRQPGDAPVVGKDAVMAHEHGLIALTENTLLMDVEQIMANDHFGAVMGVLRAELHGRSIGMPFCGLWRFRDGRIIEHWENAYDVAAFGRFVADGAAGGGAADTAD